MRPNNFTESSDSGQVQILFVAMFASGHGVLPPGRERDQHLGAVLRKGRVGQAATGISRSTGNGRANRRSEKMTFSDRQSFIFWSEICFHILKP